MIRAKSRYRLGNGSEVIILWNKSALANSNISKISPTWSNASLNGNPSANLQL
jgi:hypothetical protein